MSKRYVHGLEIFGDWLLQLALAAGVFAAAIYAAAALDGSGAF